MLAYIPATRLIDYSLFWIRGKGKYGSWNKKPSRSKTMKSFICYTAIIVSCKNISVCSLIDLLRCYGTVVAERCLRPSQLPSGVASLSSFYVKVGSVLHKSIIFHLFSDTSTCIWKGTCSLYDISIKRRINYPLGLNWGLGCGLVLMHLCAKRHFYF